MNRKSLGALVVLNIVLLSALAVVTLTPEPAAAQFGGARGEYVMIAGEVVGLNDRALLYIMELKSQRMVAATFDSRNGEFDIVAVQQIAADAAGGGRRAADLPVTGFLMPGVFP